jgi:hypothetical protein
MNKHRFHHESAPRRVPNTGRKSTKPKTGKTPVHPLYHERVKTLRLLKAIEDGKGMRYFND